MNSGDVYRGKWSHVQEVYVLWRSPIYLAGTVFESRKMQRVLHPAYYQRLEDSF